MESLWGYCRDNAVSCIPVHGRTRVPLFSPNGAGMLNPGNVPAEEERQ